MLRGGGGRGGGRDEARVGVEVCTGRVGVGSVRGCGAGEGSVSHGRRRRVGMMS